MALGWTLHPKLELRLWGTETGKQTPWAIMFLNFLKIWLFQVFKFHHMLKYLPNIFSFFLKLAQRLFLLFNTKGSSLQEDLDPQHPARPIRRNGCFRVSDIPLLSPSGKAALWTKHSAPLKVTHILRHYVISLTTSSSSPSDYIC